MGHMREGDLHYEQYSKNENRYSCGKPVSYTHLDVYKRQLPCKLAVLYWHSWQQKSTAVDTYNLLSVFYTHLFLQRESRLLTGLMDTLIFTSTVT